MEVPMTYEILSKQMEQLSYRDKFRLAQLLIQLARKEEEETRPERKQVATPTAKLNSDLAYRRWEERSHSVSVSIAD